MTTTEPATADPGAGLTCPLCRYDLRGLADPRCPECGFRFTWAELADDQRHGHAYLFELARRRPLRALWSTYWRTCRPRRFWRDVSPANPVRLRRLLVYAALANGWLALLAVGLLAASLVTVYLANRSDRASYLLVAGHPGTFKNPSYSFTETAAELDAEDPLPPSPAFFRQAMVARWGDLHPSPYAAAAVVLAWPGLTWATLLMFQASMRRARVDRRHVLRVVVYGCDFTVLMTAATVAWTVALGHVPIVADWVEDTPAHTGVPLAGVVLTCAAVATYRLSFAYARYLRFDRPVLTVLASQAVVVLFVGVVLVRTA